MHPSASKRQRRAWRRRSEGELSGPIVTSRAARDSITATGWPHDERLMAKSRTGRVFLHRSLVWRLPPMSLSQQHHSGRPRGGMLSPRSPASQFQTSLGRAGLLDSRAVVCRIATGPSLPCRVPHPFHPLGTLCHEPAESWEPLRNNLSIYWNFVTAPYAVSTISPVKLFLTTAYHLVKRRKESSRTAAGALPDNTRIRLA